jgi:putative transferase (TIGR04331 family)
MSRDVLHLIISSDEKTWRYDCPVIFLGEWCKPYSQKNVWQKLDYIVAEPYGLGREKKDKDNYEARIVEESLFNLIYTLLNKHHEVDYSKKFWRIIVGHWLRRYVDVITNRYKTIEQCLIHYPVNSVTTYRSSRFSTVPIDYRAALLDFDDDFKNNLLYTKILSFLNFESIKIISNPLKIDKNIFEEKNKLIAHDGFVRILLRFINLFSRSSDAFMIDTYLPFLCEIKLQLALGQIPQKWRSPSLPHPPKTDVSLRNKLCEDLISDSNSKTPLEKVLFGLLFEYFPVTYLEGFNSARDFVKNLQWPKMPEFIFTCNAFSGDEVFKLWSAFQVEKGVEYIIGQHGSFYGTHRNWYYDSVEEIIASKFLTWGWTDKLPQHLPSYILKTQGRSWGSYNPFGGLLLVELHLNQRITIWDGTYEFSQYFSEQISLVSNLKEEIKKVLTIRLHSSSKNSNWQEIKRWEEIDSSLKIDQGHSSITNLIKNSRLVVYSYDSTGILESLSQNIPMLAFWQNDLDHLRDSAIPFYQILVDVGIVHLNPISIARKINEIWDDVDRWWMSNIVQNARREFCDRYARTSATPVRELKKLLLKKAS